MTLLAFIVAVLWFAGKRPPDAQPLFQPINPTRLLSHAVLFAAILSAVGTRGRKLPLAVALSPRPSAFTPDT